MTHFKYDEKAYNKVVSDSEMTHGYRNLSLVNLMKSFNNVYDNVGLPAKSGVGGGIVAVVPDVMGIAVFSPRLNAQGNSLVGTKALELFTTKSGLSIF